MRLMVVVVLERVNVMEIDIRPARPADREAVLAISAQIWEGHDYLPGTWESWLHDPTGPLLVATADGRPVAVEKITLQGPEEAWLEGMRVDPAHQRQGITTRVMHYTLEWLDRRGVYISRLSTASDNVPIHRAAERHHFRRAAAITHKRVPLEKGEPERRPWVVRPAQVPPVWALLAGSEFWRASSGLYGVGWKWMRLSESRFMRHVQRREVLGWGDEQDPAAVAIVAYRSPQVPRFVAALAGDREAALALLRSLCWEPNLVVTDPENVPQLRLAVPEGATEVDWIAGQAGLSAQTPWGMWLFERDAREARA